MDIFEDAGSPLAGGRQRSKSGDSFFEAPPPICPQRQTTAGPQRRTTSETHGLMGGYTVNSLGANPLAAFSNDRLPAGGPRYSAPEQEDFIKELRKKVKNTDWAMLFAQGRTKALASSSWSASEERCEHLRELCKASRAVRVLEVGSFCGVGAMVMAEVLPEDGSVLILEYDPFHVDFGLDIKVKSDSFWKLSHMVGPARESLKTLVDRMKETDWKPFDLAIIDADKAGVVDYFEIIADTPGFMSETCTVAVDVTPYKGQLFNPYVKYGKPDEWVICSGESDINALRKCAKALRGFEVSESAKGRSERLLVAHRKASAASKSIGANPLAAFPNDRMRQLSSNNLIRWAAAQQGDLVEQLREAVHEEDWAARYSEGVTKIRVEPFWCAAPERCQRLQSLCKSSGAKRVLEIGTFCGVAALSMAEALPYDGRIVSLDLDEYVVNFGDDIKSKTVAWRKVSHIIGKAQESLQQLVEKAKGSDGQWTPFDLVVIDADKGGMLDYFKLLWETPGILSQRPTICVDTTPFKGQLHVQYVKGKLDSLVVKSGQDNIDAFLAFVKAIPELDVSHSSGLAVLHKHA